jgi:hypothetical protein
VVGPSDPRTSHSAGRAGRKRSEDENAQEGEDRDEPEQDSGERFPLPFPHQRTARFEMTTSPLSVTVKRFLSSSGK